MHGILKNKLQFPYLLHTGGAHPPPASLGAVYVAHPSTFHQCLSCSLLYKHTYTLVGLSKSTCVYAYKKSGIYHCDVNQSHTPLSNSLSFSADKVIKPNLSSSLTVVSSVWYTSSRCFCMHGS